MIRAGLPPTTTFFGTFFVTTLPPATTEPAPIVMPFKSTALEPIQTSSSKTMGAG